MQSIPTLKLYDVLSNFPFIIVFGELYLHKIYIIFFQKIALILKKKYIFLTKTF